MIADEHGILPFTSHTITMEHSVPQRSEEWYQLRRELVVTASRFGDAVGVGRGKPYHFYRYTKSVSESASDLFASNSYTTNHAVQLNVDA